MHKSNLETCLSIIREHCHQAKSWLIAHEVPRVCNASHFVVELNGSVRIHFLLSPAFSVGALIWIMSKASGKQSAQSLDSPEDEVGDLFCLGWIHVGIAANLLNILDGPVKINRAVVAHHRDDVGSEIFWLSIGIAADTVDLLDEVHVLSLCMLAFTLECWLPVIIEPGSQPEYPGSRFSFMLRNEVEVRIQVEDGRALPVVFGHNREFQKGSGCTDILWR